MSPRADRVGVWTNYHAIDAELQFGKEYHAKAENSESLMKTLIISDIHANYAALEAILANVRYDRLVCLGDIVSYGPDPRECVDAVLSACDVVILGNHDKKILHLHANPGEHKAAKQHMFWDLWTAMQLNERTVAQLSQCREFLVNRENDTTIMYSHNIAGSTYVYYETPEEVFEKFLDCYPADFVFFGHSHSPFVRKINKCIYVNAGSVGQPRCGNTEACGVLFENNQIEILSIPYDQTPTLENLRNVPLHSDYVSLWDKFYRLGIVDTEQLRHVESALRSAPKEGGKEA